MTDAIEAAPGFSSGSLSASPVAATSVSEHQVRSVARNGALGVMGAAGGAGLGFLLTFVVARVLGTAGSGAFFGSVALVTILTSLGALGADTGILWALPRNRTLDGGRSMRNTLRVALAPVALTSVAVATAFWFCAPGIARLIHPDNAAAFTTALHILAFAVLLGPTLQVLLQASRALGNLVPFVAVQQLGLPLARVAAVGGLALALRPGLDLLTMVWALPLLPALIVTGYVVNRRLHRTERERLPPGARRVAQGAQGFWRYSLIRGLGTAGQLSLVWLDVILVAVLTGAREAGIYAVASRFATSGELALQAMRLATSPQLSAAFAHDDRESVRELYGVTAVWAILFSWPLFLCFIGFGPWLLSLFGPGFQEGALPLAIVCVGMMFSVGAGSVGTVLLMSGRSSWSTMSIGATLCINLVLNLLLVPHLGALGASIAWTVSIVAQNSLDLWLITSRMHLTLSRPGFVTHVIMCLILPSIPTAAIVTFVGNDFTGFALNALVVIGVMAAYAYVRRTFLRIDMLPLLGRAKRLSNRKATQQQ